MLQRARVPSTRQEAVASSCPKTRVLVSYYWARPLAARCARQHPVQGPSPCQDRSASVCRGKAEKRRRHRQRLLGRHVAVLCLPREALPHAEGIATLRRSPHAHTYLGQASHRGRLLLLARSASAAAAASEAQLEPVRSIAAPVARLLLAFDRTRHTTPPSAWQLIRCTGGE